MNGNCNQVDYQLLLEITVTFKMQLTRVIIIQFTVFKVTAKAVGTQVAVIGVNNIFELQSLDAAVTFKLQLVEVTLLLSSNSC